MSGWGEAAALIDIGARETLLFAAVGFCIGGIDDLAVDLVYLARLVRHRLTRGGRGAVTMRDLPSPEVRGRMAIFVAAWDESAVIGAMLASALARIDHPDYRIYVGTYPNDRPTIDAVAAVAAGDARVRLVIGTDPGPTTKAACLNTLWRALRHDEERDGARVRAVVLHDAEDVVHRDELRLFDRYVDRHMVVQLPVLPLIDPASRLVSGHYADEFAEAHAKQLQVRTALGAALPLAGVGCAITPAALDAIAAQQGGEPFDPGSLTEDYELGLRIAALGGTGMLARVREYPGGPLVAVRAFFPSTLDAAVRQKARWMTGIALAGWDRVGWSRRFDLGEHWMRMRDRRAPLALLVLGAAYLSIIAGALAALLHLIDGHQPPPEPVPGLIFSIDLALLGWRLGMRAAFTGGAYGWRQAIWSVPRAFVGNVIALLAARRALTRYVGMLRGTPIVWDKTAHAFPADCPA